MTVGEFDGNLFVPSRKFPRPCREVLVMQEPLLLPAACRLAALSLFWSNQGRTRQALGHLRPPDFSRCQGPPALSAVLSRHAGGDKGPEDMAAALEANPARCLVRPRAETALAAIRPREESPAVLLDSSLSSPRGASACKMGGSFGHQLANCWGSPPCDALRCVGYTVMVP